MVRVAVLHPLPPDVQAVVRACAGPALELTFVASTEHGEILRVLKDADYAVTQTVKLGAAELAAAPKLRLLHKWGVGVDGIDLEAAEKAGIPVLRTPGRNAETVADLTVGLMLAVLRRIPAARDRLRDGRWRAENLWLEAGDLYQKTVGLVGFGAIGKAVARRLAGFDCRVLYTASRPRPQARGAAGSPRQVDFGELLQRSDIVSLHCPLTPATRGMIARSELAMMRCGAVLINTARGALVDEDALVDALRTGKLSGAGLDVFAEEPLPPSHPLMALESVVATPHVGGKTSENLQRVVRHWADNIRTHALSGAVSRNDLATAS